VKVSMTSIGAQQCRWSWKSSCTVNRLGAKPIPHPLSHGGGV
jgi:hypothetical protein